MQLELGKKYGRRDGQITGPLEPTIDHIKDERICKDFPFFDPIHLATYRGDGRYTRNKRDTYDQDLVCEYELHFVSVSVKPVLESAIWA